MSQLDTGGEEQGSLPKGWAWARLRDIAELKGD